jgi:hypothetical protein
LKGHGHLVILVQLLVEAFPSMRGQLDIVCAGGPQQAAGSQED